MQPTDGHKNAVPPTPRRSARGIPRSFPVVSSTFHRQLQREDAYHATGGKPDSNRQRLGKAGWRLEESN